MAGQVKTPGEGDIFFEPEEEGARTWEETQTQPARTRKRRRSVSSARSQPVRDSSDGGHVKSAVMRSEGKSDGRET